MRRASPVPESDSTSSVPWENAVSVREDSELAQELTARYAKGSGERAIGVTDLLALRKAYYRRAAPPVPIPPDRQLRLDQGRALHRTLGTLLSGEGILEARVRRDGLVGRIDILSDLPVEVKSSSALVEPAKLAIYRPDHIEQLAMYCGLLDRPNGRLLTLVVDPTGVSDVQAVDVAFRSASSILAEMRRRAALLRSAWKEAQVDGLPRCPWFGRGCEFEEASVCACSGAEAPDDRPLTEEVESVSARGDVRDRVRSVLSPPIAREELGNIGRFREILYPRRAYFERTAATALPAVAAPVPTLGPDLYGRLTEAVESGPPGEVARIPARSAEPEEEVVGFRGRPLVMRTSRARSRIRANDLVRRAPQYALDLGLRCAVTGTDSGIVVVGFERPEHDPDRLEVLEIRFSSLTLFSRIYRERSRGLATALRERTPTTLPPCPAWMAQDCPYRSECGCAGAGSRVTR